VSAHLLDREGVARPAADRAGVEEKLAEREFFWLDLHNPGPDEIALLQEVFEFHPLTASTRSASS
jgi:Mg2+ and Co2+ transporter CorA